MGIGMSIIRTKTKMKENEDEIYFSEWEPTGNVKKGDYYEA